WGHWPLNEGEGEIAKDLGPRGYDGEIGNYDFGGLGPDGSVWFDDPERGMVIIFAGDPDGAWDFAGFMPDLLTLDDVNDFTWSFWARQTKTRRRLRTSSFWEIGTTPAALIRSRANSSSSRRIASSTT